MTRTSPACRRPTQAALVGFVVAAWSMTGCGSMCADRDNPSGTCDSVEDGGLAGYASSTDRRYFPSFLDSGSGVPSDAGEALLAARGREKSREAASGVSLGRKPQVWQSQGHRKNDQAESVS